MARQANPKIQSSKMFSRSSRMKSSGDYLKELEDLLKLNRGGFSTFAEDTGADSGFIVPGAMASRMGQFVPQTAGQTKQINATPPEYPSIPQQEEYPQQVETPQDYTNIESFLDAFDQSINTPVSDPAQIEDLTGLAYAQQSLQDGGVLYSDGKIRYEDGTIRDGDPAAYAVQSMTDGNIRYSDGSVRRTGSPGEYASQDNIDLSAYTDLAKYLGYDVMQPGDPGQRGLITSIFGQDQVVTQPYGVYNPIEPTPGNINLGTDIRTRNLEGEQRYLKLPVDAKVIQVLQDDGTRFGDYSGHQGYGNSILVQLPTGEMLRFSHLSSLVNIQPGETLRAGEVFGEPGTTGNTYGEHLDLEYYNANGQIDNPENFTGFTNPQYFNKVVGPMSSEDPNIQSMVQRMTGEPQGPEAFQQPQALTISSPLIQQAMQARDAGSNIIQSLAGDAVQTAQSEPVQQAARTAGQAIAPAINAIQPTGKTDFGVTEGLITPEAASTRLESVKQQPAPTGIFSRARQSLGNLTEAVGDYAGIPESIISETIAGGPTRHTNQAMASEINAAQAQNQPRESLGIKDKLQNLGQNLQSKVSNAFSNLTGNSPVESNKASIEEFQPGAGVQSLANNQTLASGANANLFSRANLSDLAPDRAVGSSGGLGVQSTAGTSKDAGSGERDTTDPFFQSPLFQAVKSFSNLPDQTALPNQALSLDVFNNDFYSDPGRANAVFGDTFLSDQALDKATQSVVNAYKQKYSGGEWDQNSVNQILSQLPKQLTFTPDLPEPARVPVQQPSLNDYLAMGKTAAQWFAETGQQSTADALRAGGATIDRNITYSPQQIDRFQKEAAEKYAQKPGESVVEWMKRTGGQSSIDAAGGPEAFSRLVANPPSVGQARGIHSTGGAGVPAINYGSRTVYADKNKVLVPDSSGWTQQVSADVARIPGTDYVANFITPTKTPSAQLSQRNTSGGDSGVFNRSKEFASGIFKRFFN